MSDNAIQTLIFIPKNANYIEILGHKIDGFESFDAFCEHLKKYAELEETVRQQKAEIDRLQTELGIKDLEYSLLERERARDICEFTEELKAVEVQAYKEILELLKGNLYRNSYGEGMIFEEEIDILLKEKIGDNNAK